jgi:transcriptional regulator with XRE-family HTH domain
VSEGSGENPGKRPDQTSLASWLDSMVPARFPSDAALARAVGVEQSYITRWRRGVTPSLPSLLKLAKATGTSAETLMHIAGYRPDPGEDDQR